MTLLAPMDQATFDAFKSASLAEYAEDNVLAGRWRTGDALARAQAEFDRLAPQGLQSPGHRFFSILSAEGGPVAGHLWLALSETDGERIGFLYNIRLEPAFRGQGHAARALAELDRLALELGVTVLRLHVFALNARALALYRAAGYGITGMNMLKWLQRDEGP